MSFFCPADTLCNELPKVFYCCQRCMVQPAGGRRVPHMLLDETVCQVEYQRADCDGSGRGIDVAGTVVPHHACHQFL